MVAALVASTTTCLANGDGSSDTPWAVAMFPSRAEFSLEIAVTPQDRARGYMFREHVGPGEGMLFVFEAPGHHAIWMKNCLVALDLVWLDGDFRVVHIERDRPPCPDEGPCPSVAPMRRASYVLEVAAGRTSAEGLEVGDQLQIVGELP